MSAVETGVTPQVADVLRGAADLLTRLALRVTRVDLHRALRQAAAQVVGVEDSYRLGQSALDAYADSLRAAGRDDRIVSRWTTVRSRDEVVAELRAAADAGLAVAA